MTISRMWIGRAGVGAALAMSSLTNACGSGDEPALEVGEAREPLAAIPGSVLWPNGIVPICWDVSMVTHPQYTKMTNRIMEVVNDHLPRAANLQFEDAGPCAPDTSNARGALHVYEMCPTGTCPFPNSASWGYNTLTDPNQQPYVSFNGPEFNGSPREQAVILHEFTHAIGFQHEHQRTDFVPTCGSFQENIAGMTTYTAPDFDSIMNSTYCHSRTILSAADKTALARTDLYGAPGTQRLITFARDSGADLQANWWTGSTWAWTELTTNNSIDRISAVATRFTASHQLHVFSMTSASNLMVSWFGGAFWDTSTVTDKTLGSPPSAISYRDYGKGPNGSYAESPMKIHAFVVDTAGTLFARSWNGSWSWVNHGKPAGTNLIDVSAISFRDWNVADEAIYAFVRRGDNQLQLRWGFGSPNTWTENLSGPNGGTIGQHTAISYRDFNQRLIFLWTTSAGNLWTYHWNGGAWSWNDLGNPGGGVTVSGKVSASSWTVNGVRWHSVYVVGSNGRLYEREWNGASWRWVSHGKPAAASSVSGPSSLVYREPGTQTDPEALTPINIFRHINVRGSDEKLYVRWTSNNGATWSWSDQTTPFGGPNLPGANLASLAYYSR